MDRTTVHKYKKNLTAPRPVLTRHLIDSYRVYFSEIVAKSLLWLRQCHYIAKQR